MTLAGSGGTGSTTTSHTGTQFFHLQGAGEASKEETRMAAGSTHNAKEEDATTIGDSDSGAQGENTGDNLLPSKGDVREGNHTPADPPLPRGCTRQITIAQKSK